VEGDDENEPIADTVRGLLDGHVWLSRKLAARGHYPAIDVLPSISRLMKDVTSPQHRAAAQTIRQLLSAYAEHEDLLSIGAYRRGSNRSVDAAVDMRDAIDGILRQATDQALPFEQTVERLVQLASQCQIKLNPVSNSAAAATIVGTGAPAAA
jgi:flagellum-specific ATP synthase